MFVLPFYNKRMCQCQADLTHNLVTLSICRHVLTVTVNVLFSRHTD